MNQLSTFAYLSNTIRVVEIDGQPWFVASDVCRVLDYDIARRGVTSFISAVRSDERCMITKDNTPELFWGKRGQPQKIALSESGLYKLIMRSDKPQARKFQDWVTREVLPSIRKNGGYILGQEQVKTGEMSVQELRVIGDSRTRAHARRFLRADQFTHE